MVFLSIFIIAAVNPFILERLNEPFRISLFIDVNEANTAIFSVWYEYCVWTVSPCGDYNFLRHIHQIIDEHWKRWYERYPDGDVGKTQ